MPPPKHLAGKVYRQLAKGTQALRFGRAKADDAESTARPKLRVVRTAEDLTPEERAFLPHLLELEETPPSPIQRRLLWTLLALVAVALTWTTLGEISIVSSAQGKFIPDGKVKQVQPMETSVVKAIHVTEGQHVKQGDLLLELDPTINAAELGANTEQLKINHLEQARLGAELTGAPPTYQAADGKTDTAANPGTSPSNAHLVALQENLRQARDAAYRAKLEQAQATVQEKDAALAAAQSALRKYTDLTAIAKQREEDARPLLETGAISRLDYLQLKQDLVTDEHDRLTQTQAVEQAHHAATEARQQLAEVRHSHTSDIYTTLAQKVYDASGLTGSVEKSQQLYDLKWLRAPVDGLVQRVDVTTTGGVVTPAQSLVTIVPEGTPLIVEASLSNEDIGYVRAGQAVEIKVDTFPFQKYGTVKGTLVWVSPDAEEKPNSGQDSQSQNGKASPDPKANKPVYTYKVHIRPDKSHFVVDGKPVPIQPGMTVQADIQTDHRRIIEFFLAPVVKYLDEGLKVR